MNPSPSGQTDDPELKKNMQEDNTGGNVDPPGGSLSSSAHTTTLTGSTTSRQQTQQTLGTAGQLRVEGSGDNTSPSVDPLQMMMQLQALQAQMAEHAARLASTKEDALIQALANLSRAQGRAPYKPPVNTRVPVFNGKRPVKFLNDYSRYATDQGWDATQKVTRLADHCTESISQLVDASNHERNKTWEEMRTFFRDSWGNAQISTDISRANRCVMTDNDTVMTWHTRVQMVFQEIDNDRVEWNLVNGQFDNNSEHELKPLKEQDKVAKVLELVHHRYFQVLNRNFTRHNKMADVLRALQTEERVYKELEKRSSSSSGPRVSLAHMPQAHHLNPLVRGPPSSQVKKESTELIQTWMQDPEGVSDSSNQGVEAQIQQGISKYISTDGATLAASNAKLKLELDKAKRENQKLMVGQLNEGKHKHSTATLAPYVGQPTQAALGPSVPSTATFCIWCRNSQHLTLNCPERCSRCAGRHPVSDCHSDWRSFDCNSCGGKHHDTVCPYTFLGVPDFRNDIARKKREGRWEKKSSSTNSSRDYRGSGRGRGSASQGGRGRGFAGRNPYKSPQKFRNNSEYFTEHERTGRTDGWSKEAPRRDKTHRHQRRSRSRSRERRRKRARSRSSSPRRKRSGRSRSRSKDKKEPADGGLKVAQQAAQLAILSSQQQTPPPQPPPIPQQYAHSGIIHPSRSRPLFEQQGQPHDYYGHHPRTPQEHVPAAPRDLATPVKAGAGSPFARTGNSYHIHLPQKSDPVALNAVLDAMHNNPKGEGMGDTSSTAE